MLRLKDWIQDPRPVNSRNPLMTWQEWLGVYNKPRERWFMDVVNFLLYNQDWSGAYLLIRTFIATVKQKEGVGAYNTSPTDESPHVRVLRLWFWSLVEEHKYAAFEMEPAKKEKNKGPVVYPFVGGKPLRRATDATEFFKELVDAPRGREKPKAKDASE